MFYNELEWDESDRESFGCELRRVRYMRGLTQAELAQKVGVLHTTISNYEVGVSAPDYKTLIAISKALRVDPGVFNVNWRLCDADCDVVPEIIQVQKDFFSGEFTKYFVYLTNEYLFMNCKAYIVPPKYTIQVENKVDTVIVAPSLGTKLGRVIAILTKNDVYIGKYTLNENNEEILEPFNYFNPDFNECVKLADIGYYKVVGTVISYNSQFINTL